MSNRRNFDLCPRGAIEQASISCGWDVENPMLLGEANENDTTKGLGPFGGPMQAHLGFVLRIGGRYRRSWPGLGRFAAMAIGSFSPL